MIDGLSFALALGCVVAALTLAGRLVGRRFRWTRAVPLLALIEAGLVVQAVLDAVGLARGHEPAETSTHVAYLLFSVVVLPIAASQTRGDDGVWAGTLLVVALIVVAVLVVRLQATWRSG